MGKLAPLKSLTISLHHDRGYRPTKADDSCEFKRDWKVSGEREQDDGQKENGRAQCVWPVCQLMW